MASETITVRRTENSTSLRKFDFDAWYGDIDLGVTVGHGATPNEAIVDLEEGFVENIQKRSMSSWSAAEMNRYNKLTGQEESR